MGNHRTLGHPTMATITLATHTVRKGGLYPRVLHRGIRRRSDLGDRQRSIRDSTTDGTVGGRMGYCEAADHRISFTAR